MDPPDLVEAIRFGMGQQGLTQRDLEEIIGTRLRIAEVLKSQAELSIANDPQTAGTHRHLGGGF